MQKPRKSYIQRLLSALADIYENPDVIPEEKLQAVKLSVEVLGFRQPVKRKTDLDRAKIAALENMNKQKSKEKAGENPQPKKIPENGKD